GSECQYSLPAPRLSPGDGPLLAALLGVTHQFLRLQGQPLQGLRVVAPVLLANDAVVVDQKEGRDGLDLPPAPDRAGPPVEPGSPVELFALHGGLGVLLGGIAVDAEQHERPARQLEDHLLLVRVARPAGRAPVAPEIDDHYLAAVVAEFERLAVE